MTAMTYCDGDFSQIDAIKSSFNLFTNNKAIANKKHASWSEVKQPADLAKVFRLIKNMLPSYTVKNIPAERCPMKALMSDAFKEKLEDLNLAPNKRHSLIDFISTLSVMATKACTVKYIQHGFIEAGMIDINNLRYPVFDKIISTCQQTQSVEEYKNIENNMKSLASLDIFPRRSTIVLASQETGIAWVVKFCKMPQFHKKVINVPNA